MAHGRLEVSGHPGSRRPRESGSHPDDPARHCARWHRRGCNTLRALAQIRGETGSLETAPSATPSRRCSHSGIAPGLTAVFSLYVGRFRRSREKRRRNEGRPRRGGSRSAGDRLASRVSWSGVGAPGIPARGRRMVDRTSARRRRTSPARRPERAAVCGRSSGTASRPLPGRRAAATPGSGTPAAASAATFSCSVGSQGASRWSST